VRLIAVILTALCFAAVVGGVMAIGVAARGAIEDQAAIDAVAINYRPATTAGAQAQVRALEKIIQRPASADERAREFSRGFLGALIPLAFVGLLTEFLLRRYHRRHGQAIGPRFGIRLTFLLIVAALIPAVTSAVGEEPGTGALFYVGLGAAMLVVAYGLRVRRALAPSLPLV
jgi:hypothetical protein